MKFKFNFSFFQKSNYSAHSNNNKLKYILNKFELLIICVYLVYSYNKIDEFVRDWSKTIRVLNKGVFLLKIDQSVIKVKIFKINWIFTQINITNQIQDIDYGVDTTGSLLGMLHTNPITRKMSVVNTSSG